jgi:hypothetical protein
VEDQDQGEEGKGAGGDADGGTAAELADFRRDLGLGELDLLADEDRGGIGGGFSMRLAGICYSGGSSLYMRR